MNECIFFFLPFPQNLPRFTNNFIRTYVYYVCCEFIKIFNTVVYFVLIIRTSNNIYISIIEMSLFFVVVVVRVVLSGFGLLHALLFKSLELTNYVAKKQLLCKISIIIKVISD